nr:MAG TPA: hypothetical protein [Caudoviricetes sp.]DAQ86076.1 MAG TPA: hypothetical protein [Herelleviridae sp.]DAV67024.1 MAG TPA: hypothetical protein [Caudoviricetes sp.]
MLLTSLIQPEHSHYFNYLHIVRYAMQFSYELL